MEKEKKSRREALGLIGKAGVIMGAAPYFFVSLNIIPERETDYKSESSGRQKYRTKDIKEKAVVSGSGSQLTVKVSGKPGRHYFVAVAGSDIRENYGAYPNSEGIINSRGLGSKVIDLKILSNSRIYIKIVTGETDKFDSQLAETEPFIVNLKGGTIAAFEGVVSRPILEHKGSMISVASTAAVCSINKIK
jgi:hypothetical protein